MAKGKANDAIGVALDGKRLRSHRDSSIKARICSLEKDKGYPVEELSTLWGVMTETIRKHARQFDCLRYVEVSPGNWVHCILHPDTAKKLGGV